MAKEQNSRVKVLAGGKFLDIEFKKSEDPYTVAKEAKEEFNE